MKTAYLFPGQGAQYPGIGADLHADFAVVRDTYAEAADALGYDIAALSFTAAAADINLTRHTQPVLLTHAIACLRALQAQTETAAPVLAAGHSLGEYTALVSAGVLSFAQALRLVRTRGELMGRYGRGEMEALTLPAAAAAELASRHHCGVAACNLPQQTVVGGAAADLDALLADLRQTHPRARNTRLKTEGAFHTYHMVEAALNFRDTLAAAEFHAPRCPVLSNFTGGAHDAAADAVKSRLFLQLFNPVLWHENLLAVAAAAPDRLIEFGGGIGSGDSPASMRPNLEGMVKKVCRATEPAPQYLAVINTQTLTAAVAAITAAG